ncbi:MAG: serine/threonine protein kinase [Myxococcales bacterium]|nr:serine/threonine protein kinase [Myxococcales bacterium]
MKVVPLETGAVFADKYRIDGVLGKGGMGVVYAATNLAVGRRVAIKVMEAGDADAQTRQDMLHRFRLEAQAAAVIDHSGIVDVLDMGETDEGSPFIVMEFLEGATLKATLKQLKVMTPAQAVAVMGPVLEALTAAHAAGVVHRDIKPANIFLCTRPKHAIKVLDFGISRFGEGSGVTQTGQSMGTPQYMSPEQVKGERGVGPESDLYSVGAVLYHLLTGAPPFESTGGEMATLARVLSTHPTPVREVKPELPVALGKLVDGLLVKERAQRERDAMEVRRLLLAITAPEDGPVWAAASVAVKQELAKGGTPRPGSNSKRSAPGVLAMPGRTPSKPSVPRAGPRPPPEETIALAPSRRPLVLFAALAALVLAGGGGAYVLFSKAEPAPTTGVDAPAPRRPKVEPQDGTGTAAPAPVEVELTLSADPKEARFVVDGEALDCNPCTLKRKSGAKLAVKASAERFVASEFELVFDRPQDKHVALAPVPSALSSPGKKPKKPRTPLTVDESNPYR